ncbi:MAG: hypothetical protein JKY89_09060 [Immundisolibacteraceae bacterium]|nr:hypothetical protein [Immundisolibacteraceae bacterium]
MNKKIKLTQFVQTSLIGFNTIVTDQYSQTIELYDAIPKYVWGNQNRINGKFLDPIIRPFKHKGKDYIAKITPAAVEVSKGEFKYFFPSQREELVEDALRKLASDGQGVFLQDKLEKNSLPMASVLFTLYELQKELKRMGHSYNINQIKESLNICANTGVILESTQGSGVIISNIFDTLGLESKDDVGNGKATKCFVRFNLLVTKSINDKTYRLLNYDACMSYKKSLARWLHKRMSHNYRQASLRKPYTIHLSTIIRDSGITASKRIATTLQRIESALDELKDSKMILMFEVEKILSDKLVDAKIVIYPDSKFVSDIIKGNKLNKKSEIT